MKHVLSKNSTTKLSNIQQGDSQPNAVDLRLGKVLRLASSLFSLSEEEKLHRGSYEIQPNYDGWWNLPEGHYEVVMENVIEVGEGEAGWVITRSTLNRNGVFLTSGLYDTGYNGVMAGMMHVTCGAFRVRKGTRIGQYLSFDAENLSSYKGSYGIGTADDSKYGAPTSSLKNTRVDIKGMSVRDLAKCPKDGLTWYQIKKINAAVKEVKKLDKIEAAENEKRAREELAERAREQQEAIAKDAIQATVTHIVVKGDKKQ